MIAPESGWFVYSLWFAWAHRRDRLLFFYKDADGGMYVRVRLRIHDPTKPDADPFEFRDYKTPWATIPIKAGTAPEKVRRSVCETLDSLGPEWEYDHVRIDGDGEEVVRKLRDRPWAHVRKVKSEDELNRYVKRKGPS